MSALHQAVADYLVVRRALGFKLVDHDRLLSDLVDFLESAGARTLTTALAVEWATQPVGHREACVKRMSIVRGFARYLRTLDPATEVPPTGLIPQRRRRDTPYLYSDTEISALLAATGTLRPPLRAMTYRTVIGLLAVSGMRIGEAIALDCGDVDFPAGCLTVRAGKFGASRRLPLHPSTLAELEGFCRARDQRWPPPSSAAFFPSATGTRLIHTNVWSTFQDLLAVADIQARPGARRPRIHDVRHTFAVRTLIDWYRSEVDVAAYMPRLSTYLGHSAPASTYWYLQAEPELLALAAARLEQEPPR